MRTLYLLIFLTLVPFLWLLTQYKILDDPIYFLGNFLGLLGGILIGWEMLLGIRAVTRIFTHDRVALVNLHKFLGIYIIVFIFAHPIAELLVYRESLDFLFRIGRQTNLEWNVTLGRVAFLSLLTIWITSAIIRKKISYRIWKAIHFLTYPLAILVFVHAQSIGIYLQTFPLLKIYWFAWLAIIAAAMLYRIYHTVRLARSPFTLTNKVKIGDDITVYTLTAKRDTKLPKPGQYAYLKPHLFSEEHPFSIMRTNAQKGEITFGIKTAGKFTQQLMQSKIGDTFYIDGFYGTFTQEGQSDHPKIIIAGGIGITPFIDLIFRHHNDQTYLIYCNQSHSQALFDQEFHQLLGDRYLQVLSRDANTSHPQILSKTRLHHDIVRQHIPMHAYKHAQWFICGSPGFTQTVQNILTQSAVPSDKIHTEAFSF